MLRLFTWLVACALAALAAPAQPARPLPGEIDWHALQEGLGLGGQQEAHAHLDLQQVDQID